MSSDTTASAGGRASRRGVGPRRAALLTGIALLVSVGAVATAGGASSRPTYVRAALPAGAIKHIFVIDLENEGYAATFGAKSPARYLNKTLRPKGVLIEHYFAIGHVSLDNYVAQVSGQAPTRDTQRDCLDTLSGALFGYVDVSPGTPDANHAKNPGQVDGNGCVYPSSVPTIASQLDSRFPPNPVTHVASWRAYAEDMGNDPTRDGGVTDPTGGTDCAHPAVGTADNAELATSSDQFTTRHVGFLFFHSVIDDAAECDANVVPLGSLLPSGVPDPDGHLATDLATIATTPRFATITPNLCDDGHDGTCAGENADGTKTGGLVGADDWLAHWMPLILSSPAYKSGSMLVVITADESDTSGKGADAACCHERPGPNVVSPVNGASSDAKAPGGGEIGALLLNPKWVHAGKVDTKGGYNDYSALRSYEDLLGLTTGGTDHHGHLGFAAQTGLVPFGKDVFK